MSGEIIEKKNKKKNNRKMYEKEMVREYKLKGIWRHYQRKEKEEIEKEKRETSEKMKIKEKKKERMGTVCITKTTNLLPLFLSPYIYIYIYISRVVQKVASLTQKECDISAIEVGVGNTGAPRRCLFYWPQP